MSKHNSVARNRAHTAIGIGLLTASGVVGAGCDNAGQGALSGGSIGALSGLAIGSLSGDAGKGAAIGAVVGGLGGAVIGDQNKRSSQSAKSGAAEAPRPLPIPSEEMSEADYDRLALAKLEGTWSMTGWSELLVGDRRVVSGSAVGSIHQSYYLTLDINAVTDPVTGDLATGTLTFASEPGRGITLESRTSNAPAPARFRGSTSANRQVFTLKEDRVSMTGVRRQMTIRFLNDNQWVAEINNLGATGQPLIGSFTFTRPG